MRVLVWTGVALLGGFAALLRFAVDGAISERAGSAFPWGTLVVNLSGAFVLGLLAVLVLIDVAALRFGSDTRVGFDERQ